MINGEFGWTDPLSSSAAGTEVSWEVVHSRVGLSSHHCCGNKTTLYYTGQPSFISKTAAPSFGINELLHWQADFSFSLKGRTKLCLNVQSEQLKSSFIVILDSFGHDVFIHTSSI